MKLGVGHKLIMFASAKKLNHGIIYLISMATYIS